jgi:hypothetical protein
MIRTLVHPTSIVDTYVEPVKPEKDGHRQVYPPTRSWQDPLLHGLKLLAKAQSSMSVSQRSPEKRPTKHNINYNFYSIILQQNNIMSHMSCKYVPSDYSHISHFDSKIICLTLTE